MIPSESSVRAAARRCVEANLPAWTFAEDGRPIPFVWCGSGTVAKWLNAPSILAMVADAASSARHMPTGTALTLVEPSPGLRLMPFSVRAAPGELGVVVALAPGAALTTSDAFARACAEAGVSTAWARGEFDPLVRLNAQGAAAMFELLRLSIADAAALVESRVTINGFTRQLTEAFDTIDFLYGLGRAMRDPGRPDDFLRLVCERLHTTMEFGWVAAAFPPNPHDMSRGASPKLFGTEFANGVTPHGVRERLESLVRAQRDRTSSTVLENVEGLSTPSRSQVLLQPILRGGKPVGAIAAGDKHGSDPDVSSYDTQLVEAASGFAASFLETVHLHEEQQALFMGTLRAITAAIDAKDRYTRGHSERVAYLATALAAETGSTPEQCERVRIAGLVHDVGKIGVPEAVLTKAGRLTDAEFEHIKRHPEMGHIILRDIPQLADVLPGVLHHHERWDGAGYPHRLTGEHIPLLARVIALADTFDAMSSNRSYRPAMPRERVLAEVARCAGTQFDPALSPLFLRIDLAEYDRMVARHAEGHAIAA